MSKKPARPTHSRVVAKQAKPATHAKAAPSNAQLQKEISSLQKQVASLKHPPAKKAKTAKAKKHATAKRGLALGSSVACCAAEALAASARLAGHLVTDTEVLALHRLAGGDDDGAEVLAEAAAEYGLAGVRLAWFGPAEPGWDPAGWRGEGRLHLVESAEHPVQPYSLACLPGDAPVFADEFFPGERGGDAVPGRGHGLILGVELPGGPHTLTLDPSGLVWSWGDLYDPAALAAGPAEEAWAVTWRQ